jgi:hypothetical protein
MPTKRADITANRDGNNVTVAFRNFETGDRVNLWRANYNGSWTRIQDRGALASIVDSVASTAQPRYKGQFLDDSGSRQVWNTSTQVWDTSTEKWADLPSGVPSISKFTL